MYKLDTSRKGKTNCPNCGAKNSYRKYKSDTSDELYNNGFLCGICDRANSCGHHIKPEGEITENNKVSEPVPDPIILKIKEAHANALKICLNNTESNFHAFCKSLQIPFAHLKSWGVGTDTDKTVFVFIDKTKTPVNAKYFRYNANGGRDKTFNAYSIKGYTRGTQEYKYRICLYGEHLIDKQNSNIIIVVESEKTAVIASYFYPNFNWVSCAAADSLTDDKAKVLKGFTVVWLCDADAKGRKNASLNTLLRNKIKHKVVDLFPDRTDGYDIADAIRDGLRPELRDSINNQDFVNFAPKKDKKQANDIFVNLQPEKPLKSSSPEANEPQTKTLGERSRINADELAHPITYGEEGITYWAGGRAGIKTVANGFQVFIRYQNKDENDKVYWLLEIVSTHVDIDKRFKPITVELNNEQFNSARYWKSEFTKYALSFKADDTILTELIEFLLLFRKFNKATRVLRYGWHEPSKTFLFANRGFDGQKLIEPDENGMLQVGEKHISLPQLKTSNNVNFFWTDTKFTFNQWYKLYAMAYPKEAFFVANHYIMTLFLDISQHYGKKNPILYIKGKPNSGKTTMIEVLSYNYGFKQNKTSLKSNPTPRAVAKLLNQTQNGFLHCDEFKNGMAYTDTFISAFDFEGFERSTDDAQSGNETESFPVTRGIVITSNDEPTYEPFISRLIYLVKDDINKTESETKAFFALDAYLKQGLACISVELLAYRQLIFDNYKESFDELQKAIQGLTTDLENVETRNYSKTTQTLVIGYILSKNDKINMINHVSLSDCLVTFAMLGADQLRFQHRMSQTKTALHQFFEFFQSLYDQRRLYEGAHFRIERGQFIVNMNSFYPIYQKEFFQINREYPQSKNEIIEALKSFDKEFSVKSSMRFANVDEGNFVKNSAVKNCISVNYDKLKNTFGLDLDNTNAQIQPSF